MSAVTVKVAFRTARRREADEPSVPAATTAMARRIALAHHVEALINAGELRDLADAARRLGVTRARLTQVGDLALLAPSIQAAVLLGQVRATDRQLRLVGRTPLWADQETSFRNLFPEYKETRQ